jgi:hypothetical protein
MMNSLRKHHFSSVKLGVVFGRIRFCGKPLPTMIRGHEHHRSRIAWGGQMKQAASSQKMYPLSHSGKELERLSRQARSKCRD